MLMTVTLGCSGQFFAPTPGAPGQPNGGEGGAGGAGAGPVQPEPMPPPDLPFAAAPSGLRRLTLSQYRASLADLLGGQVNLPASLEPDVPVDGLIAIGATEVPISALGVEQYDEAARAVAQQVFADSARRSALVPCAPSLTDPGCARSSLAAFGRRAWRRPLEADELTRYVALHTTVANAFQDPWKGLEFAIAALVQSPNFLHRVELAEADPQSPGGARYRADALASRLSYFLWGTTPDEALLEAAESGALLTADGLRAQVDRLLASPRLRPALLEFFSEHLGLTRLETLQRDPVRYPAAGPALFVAMRGELDRVLSDYALTPRDFRDVLTSDSTWVNAELGAIYGVSAPAMSFAKVQFPPGQARAGLMGLSGVLAATSHGDRSSPTARGVFVRRKLLCQVIAPPPPNVSTELPVADPNANLTTRERLDEHRSNPTCAGCHAAIDPIGLGLENYDAVGTYRAMEAGKPIDPRGVLDGVTFEGAAQLGAALKGNSAFVSCLTQHLYSQAVGHSVTPGEKVTVKALQQAFASSGYQVGALISAIARSDGFLLAQGQR